MTFATLHQARTFTRLEGARSVQAHHFVRLPSGRWTRTLGTPGDVVTPDGAPLRAVRMRGRAWRLVQP